jgi:hypothetical protein
VAGLRAGPIEFSFASVEHGLYLRRGFVSVLEAGATRTAPEPYLDTDVFSIERVGAVVRYLKNGVMLYASEVPSYGEKYLQAVLYSGGDAVTDPAIGASVTSGLGAASAVLRSIAAMGGDATYAGGAASLGPFTSAATGTTAQGGGARLQALHATGSQSSYAHGSAVLQPLTAGAETATPQFAVGATPIGRLLSVGFGTTSFISLRPAKMLGDKSASWLDQSHAGKTVHIVGGTGAGQSRLIADNSAKALLFNPT